jgi:magnesium transporter
MKFTLNEEFLKSVEENLSQGTLVHLKEQLGELHPADLAEILNQLDAEEAQSILDHLENELAAEVIVNLDEDIRKQILKDYTGFEIATEVIENLDSDDAADLLQELPEDVQEAVMASLEDEQQAEEIADLLTRDEDTAGGLMAKELVKVNENWKVMRCVREMRRQAEELEHVYAVYVVNDDDVLLGTLSLKKLLTTSTRTPVKEVYDPKVVSIQAHASAEEAARIMGKYDVVVMPVVDEEGRLLGRITVDDVMDVMEEEAERDYQLASGITEDIESTDTVFTITRARVPWLFIGLLGGVVSSRIIGFFDIAQHPEMALFMPLIAAMGGNVGVQSSAIVVQAIARQGALETIASKLKKDLGVALLTGLVFAALVFILSFLINSGYELSSIVSIALFCVILIAAVMGTITPMVLHRMKIDPAVATGPFITTANDILGLIIYFSIGRLIYGA